MSHRGSQDLRRWLAIGSGVGVEVVGGELRLTLARVRPSGVEILSAQTIPDFRDRPAAEWGAEYAAFLKRHGAAYLSATVLLPRAEIIVRTLALPGVADRDVTSAIALQIDALHPYPEDEAVYAWTRVGKSDTVLIGIMQRAVLERYITLLVEAGIRASCFTFSAAAVYGAIRLLVTPPSAGFFSICAANGDIEVYGESEAHPVFSATFDLPEPRACAMAGAELRLPAETEPQPLAALLPAPKAAPPDFDSTRFALSYAAALAGACPRLFPSLNLLPAQHRATSSRMMYVPTAVLAGLLLVLAGALAALSPLEDRRYLAALEREAGRLRPLAAESQSLDRVLETTRARTRLLDDFRRRSKADIDVLSELTRLLAPPAWLNGLELTRSSVTLTGEAEQAAPLLKILDESPLFHNSEFTVPIARSGKGEVFRIRAAREGASAREGAAQ